MRAIHQFDPQRLPDDRFTPGCLDHLVPGNRGRLLDPRRTPVHVVSLDWRTGHFVVEIDAFEDRGARWEIPLEKVGNLQFALDACLAEAPDVRRMEARIAELDRPLHIPCDAARAAQTAAEIEERSRQATTWIADHSRFFAAHAAPEPTAAEGPLDLRRDALAFFASRQVHRLEEAFAAQFVSNPHSGECVKGHRIVIAELGLAPYEGRAPRDPELFDGAWSREHRAEHVLWRMAFVRAWLRRARWRELILFRGISSEKPLARGDAPTFSPASFRFDVAWSCFAGPVPHAFGRLERRLISTDRVFMTHFETDAMNRQFVEAEAVLLGDLDDSML